MVSAEAIRFPLAVARTAGGDRSASVRQALPTGRFWQAEPSSGAGPELGPALLEGLETQRAKTVERHQHCRSLGW